MLFRSQSLGLDVNVVSEEGAHAEMRDEDDDLLRAAEELGIDLSGVRMAEPQLGEDAVIETADDAGASAEAAVDAAGDAGADDEALTVETDEALDLAEISNEDGE